jgi:hypothetical protein
MIEKHFQNFTSISFTECDVNCHKKCEKLAANLCGVNQKLIVEALASVRRENQGAFDDGSFKAFNIEFDRCSLLHIEKIRKSDRKNLERRRFSLFFEFFD